jgi:anti-anti-sigma regulatory factor
MVMRQSGVVTDLRRLGPHDHVCWGFDDVSVFRAAAVSFLEVGLELGQRVWYVGEREDGVHEALAGAAPGAVEVVSLAAHYADGAVVDPVAQVEAYARATRQAIADGFAGLRVATDASPLVATRAQLEAFTRYEHRVDHLMAELPFSAMCAYNRSTLGDHAVAQLASLHPVATTGTAPFRLHASREPGCAATIGGELDLAGADLLALALDRAGLRATGGELVLDAAGLTFLDRARLGALVDHARGLGAVLVLRTDQPVPRRLVELLGLDDVRIEAVA